MLCWLFFFIQKFSLLWSNQFLYYYYYHFTPCKFFTPVLAVGLSLESKWQLIRFPGHFWVFELISTILWSCMALMILPLIFNSTRLASKPLTTIPSAPTIIGITVTFMFYSFFDSLARFKYLFICALLFPLCGSLEQQNPSDDRSFFSC